MNIPFNNLLLQHSNIRDQMLLEINRVIDESDFIRGNDVGEFEKDFANLIGVNYCISCGNGTDALYIAIKSLGLKAGEEVIVPAHTWISTSEAVTQAGGVVKFCDIDESTYNIDFEKIPSMISQKTRGIIPVHLYGNPVNMPKIMDIATAHSLWVIEDCAQAHLAKWNGASTGTFGDIATFSFYPGKNLGAIGDAGAIVTNSHELADFSARFARHGGLTKNEHTIEGINSRMDGLQAAILNLKLPKLNDWTERRQQIAKMYFDGLEHISFIKLPVKSAVAYHAWHQFVIKLESRNSLKEFLKCKGVETMITYPESLPFLAAYEYKNHSPCDFPIAFEHKNQILSLPIYPELTDDQVNYIINWIKQYYAI
jgi:dTDP-4-amino-4,6-dideoxygalactose transaminase